MPFIKGKPKTGGRKLGGANKATVYRQSINEMVDEFGFDPVKAMFELYKEANEFSEKLALLKELAPYVHTKRNALQVTGDMDLRLIERVKELEALPDEELKKLAGK